MTDLERLESIRTSIRILGGVSDKNAQWLLEQVEALHDENFDALLHTRKAGDYCVIWREEKQKGGLESEATLRTFTAFADSPTEALQEARAKANSTGDDHE